jgi:hypothetical protein
MEIKHIEPLIWRRVAVRTSIDLNSLHTVAQATVGWLDYHLWEFVIDEGKYGIPDPACAYRGRRPRCPAHGDRVIRSMTTRAAHELDGAVGFIF